MLRRTELTDSRIRTALLSILCVGLCGVVAPPVRAELFQHLDASVAGSFINGGGALTWLDQSGNNRHAADTSAGAGSVSLSTDPSVFATGLNSVRFDGTSFANYGRLGLFDAATSDAILDQSGANPAGFSVLMVVRGDTNPTTGGWNDIVGNTTDVLDGSFLMRYNYDNGRFQGAIGGKTVQNNNSGQDNYGQGVATVMGFTYDPARSSSEITLASSLNDYNQSFDLGDEVTDRDFSNNDPFTLGKAFDTVSRLFVGNVGEVKIYDTALSAGEFADEVDALDVKWNSSPDGRLDVIIDRATGNATLSSPGALDIDLVGLRLRSPSGSLDKSDWLSITDNYDADSGASALDNDDTWLKLSEKATDLSEATFGTSTITAGQTLDLGALFVLGGEEDINAELADPGAQSGLPVLVRYVNQQPADLLPGDFNDDLVVDAADYAVWRENLGASVLLPNEIVSNGRVTLEDYHTWRANYGATLAAESGASSEAAPEPGCLALLLCSSAALIAARQRERIGGRARRVASRARGFVLTAAALLLVGLFGGEALAAEAKVGAYYYPWWGGANGHDWGNTLRARMLPEDQRPAAGYHDSSDADLIADHINQSHRGNISLWAHSWWGPGSLEDNIIRQNILPHPRAGELEHSILYEPAGRLGPFSDADYSNLTPDFEYLAENVFSDPNYFRIDGRPVLFMWISRAYFNDPASQQALADARLAVQQNYGYDPYIVGDEIVPNFNAAQAAQYDAVTRYGIYGLAGLNSNGVTQSDIQQAADAFENAAASGATVIPGVVPGYNDKAVRSGNPATGRYFDNETVADAGSVFRALLQDAAVPNTDASIDNLLMVTSFNEWHEDTQIEPTIVTPPSAVDDSPSGFELTDGKVYEGYGNKYLDILREETTTGPLLLDGDADFDGVVAGDDVEDIAAFIAAWGQENLVSGKVVGGFASRSTMPDFNYDGVVDFEDWFVMRATHPSAAMMSLSDLVAAPAPSGGLLAIGVVSMMATVRWPNAACGSWRQTRTEDFV